MGEVSRLALPLELDEPGTSPAPFGVAVLALAALVVITSLADGVITTSVWVPLTIGTGTFEEVATEAESAEEGLFEVPAFFDDTGTVVVIDNIEDGAVVGEATAAAVPVTTEVGLALRGAVGDMERACCRFCFRFCCSSSTSRRCPLLLLMGDATAAVVEAAGLGLLDVVVMDGVGGEVGRLKTASGDCGDIGRMFARLGLVGALPSSVPSLLLRERGRSVDASGDMRR